MRGMKEYQRQKTLCMMIVLTQSVLYLCPPKAAFQLQSKQFYGRKKQRTSPQINLIHRLVVSWKEVIRGYLKYSELSGKIFFPSEISTRLGSVSYPVVSE